MITPNYMFKQAKIEAFKSKCAYRLGAVIVNKKIRGYGRNQFKTHPIMHRYHRPTRLLGIHAEIDACLSLPQEQLVGSDLYVCRVLRNKNMALAKPCPVCLEILRRFQVRRVFYTINKDKYGVIKL
jgi:tRNA(Arg) A34 adenosine deaminase TadA